MSTTSTHRSMALGFFALLLVALSLVNGTSASAVPPGGASPDTKGTSSSVSPKTLAAGGQLTFTVKGFPAGETLYIKIDDGDYCNNTRYGGCVIHEQKIPSSGVITGTIVLPSDLKAGSHWLRFLASEQVFTASGDLKEVKGYTRKGGGEFTITSGGTSNSGSNNAETTTQTTTQETVAEPTGESSASIGPIELEPETTATDDAAAAEAEPAAQATAPAVATTPAVTVQAASSSSEPFPLVGVVVLGLAVAGAAFALGFVTSRAGRGQ